MTREEAKKMLKAKLECLIRETSGTDIDCNNKNCDECNLCYEQGNMGEQKEALELAIKALEQEPDTWSLEDAREDFMDDVYNTLDFLPTNDEANRIIDSFDRVTSSIRREPCEDCRNCKRWNECPCGKDGHTNGTSIGYSIGECKDYEPCEDCISRQEAISAIQDEYYDNAVGIDIVDIIANLPSAQPTRPTGKWIEKEDYNLDTYYECSECGKDYCIEGDILIHKYCPNCGARMQEVEE